MIRNQWYVVLESNEVKSSPIGVTRLGVVNMVLNKVGFSIKSNNAV